MNGDIFKDDEEMRFMRVSPEWGQDELLRQEGVFFLKDVVKKLDIKGAQVKIRVKQLIKERKDPWLLMGVRRVLKVWLVKMSRFAPYYQERLKPKIRKVEPEWDANQLLRQKGLFTLVDICRNIPFTTHQLRYQAQKTANAKKKMGIWKDPDLKKFVVDMEIFGPWLANLWKTLK